MVTLPSLLLVTGTVLLGIYLGIFYLRGVRPKRILLGAHILLGIGGVEQLGRLDNLEGRKTTAQAEPLSRISD